MTGGLCIMVKNDVLFRVVGLWCKFCNCSGAIVLRGVLS